MKWMGIVGCALQTWGPVLAILVMYLKESPQLVMMGVAASFSYILATLMCSILWIAIPPLKEALAFHAFFGAVLVELCRFGFFKSYLICERGFGKRFNEVVYRTEFGTCPVAVAAGVGWGSAQSLLSFGMVFSFILEPSTTGPNATFYDNDLCPKLPYLYFLALQSCFFILSNVFWMVTTMGCYMSLQKEDSETLKLPYRAMLTTMQRNTALACVSASIVLHICASFVTVGAKTMTCAGSLPLLAVITILSGCIALYVSKSVYRPTAKGQSQSDLYGTTPLIQREGTASPSDSASPSTSAPPPAAVNNGDVDGAADEAAE